MFNWLLKMIKYTSETRCFFLSFFSTLLKWNEYRNNIIYFVLHEAAVRLPLKWPVSLDWLFEASVWHYRWYRSRPLAGKTVTKASNLGRERHWRHVAGRSVCSHHLRNNIIFRFPLMTSTLSLAVVIVARDSTAIHAGCAVFTVWRTRRAEAPEATRRWFPAFH